MVHGFDALGESMEEPKDDIELAAILGTHRNCIRRWRNRPQRDAPRGRNPVEWGRFMEQNLLGPYSPKRNYGEDASEERSAPHVSKNTNAGGEEKKWRSNRTGERDGFIEVADTMIELAQCLTKSRVTLLQYFTLGRLYIEKAGNEKARKVWTELCFNRLSEMFPTPAAAAEEFPDMVKWLHAQAARR